MYTSDRQERTWGNVRAPIRVFLNPSFDFIPTRYSLLVSSCSLFLVFWLITWISVPIVLCTERPGSMHYSCCSPSQDYITLKVFNKYIAVNCLVLLVLPGGPLSAWQSLGAWLTSPGDEELGFIYQCICTSPTKCYRNNLSGKHLGAHLGRPT